MVTLIIIILICVILFLIGKVIDHQIQNDEQKKLIKRLKEFEDRWVNKYTDDGQER